MNQTTDMLKAEPQASNEYMTTGEVAKLLHVSTWTINRLANTGQIPYIPVNPSGRIRRFPRKAIQDWADKRLMKARL